MEELKKHQEHSRRKRKEWRTLAVAEEGGRVFFHVPEHSFAETIYFNLLLSIILLARTSVEIPGTLQKLLEF